MSDLGGGDLTFTFFIIMPIRMMIYILFHCMRKIKKNDLNQ